MENKIIVQASRKYRDKLAGIESEVKAPRKIILWVIGFQIIEMSALGYLLYLNLVGG